MFRIGGTAFALALLALLAVSTTHPRSRGGGETDMGPYLVRMSHTINARLPEMVDPHLRLDTTLGGPGRFFSYVYTLTRVRSDEISAEGVLAAYAPTLRHNYCAGSHMAPFVDQGVSILYIYRGSDGGEITRIAVSASECANLEMMPVIYSA